jgi:two-component system, cell cycle sensor histidine kinase and response regulator CckA
MGVERSGPGVAAGGSRGNGRSLSLKAWVVGLVVLFVLAAGADAVGLGAGHQQITGLQAIVLAGLVLLVAATLVFYWRVARPIAKLGAGVRAVVAGRAAGPIAVAGAAEVSSLAADVNQLLAATERDFEATTRLAAIVESSTDAIIGATLDGVTTSWNAGAEDQYGYTAQEMIGRSVSVLFPPDRAGELVPILERVRQGENVEHFETKRRCKDGTILDLSISVSPIRDAHGAVTGAATVARNITERVRLEADRLALEQRLQHVERLESLGTLASGVAHDFNNLLAVIMNYAEFVAAETTEMPSVRADIEQIQAAADRAARITKQLLIVGRRQTTKPAAIELNAVLANSRDLLASAVGAAIEIRVDAAPDLPAIVADRGQVEQVLLNLAVNAGAAMPQGGTLTIETSLTDLDEGYARLHHCVGPGRYAELAVSDTGTGMSAEVVAHIFEPFFTTKPVGQGTGLGLATVYGIVTGAGGGISVDSEEGTGTTFRIFFPAIAVPTPVTEATDATPDAQGHGETILVVDDEPPVLQLTSRILRQNGYVTLEAVTFEEALSLASSHDLQLLLTDSVLPHMSGETLAQRVTALRPGLPVMFMSGYSRDMLNPPHARAEGTTFVQKPFTQRTLLEKVHAALAAPTSATPNEP